jgi:hypothetical protein
VKEEAPSVFRLTTDPQIYFSNNRRHPMVLLASAYDQSRFLKAADLEREKKFRIRNVTEESVGTDQNKERKLVVWFTNDEHGLVLNKTNNRTLRGAFGDAVDGWKDKIVVIFRHAGKNDGGSASAHSAAEAGCSGCTRSQAGAIRQRGCSGSCSGAVKASAASRSRPGR